VLEARAGFYEKPITTLDFASLDPSMMMVVFVKGSYSIIFINRLFVVAPDGNAKTKMGGPNGSIRSKEKYRHKANKEVKAKHPKVTYANLYQRSTDLDVLATKEALLYILLIQYVPTAKVVLMEAL
ncbi:L-ascorbate peroxidase 3-like protein, partial [Tanacetum coccineum]